MSVSFPLFFQYTFKVADFGRIVNDTGEALPYTVRIFNLLLIDEWPMEWILSTLRQPALLPSGSCRLGNCFPSCTDSLFYVKL